ncbi:MAG: hypothetical protein HQL48_09065 [Gammaproteobacteria bacterium]|nr:hypothetical protein [Gammaproteobacteria bacterium]
MKTHCFGKTLASLIPILLLLLSGCGAKGDLTLEPVQPTTTQPENSQGTN